MNDRFKFRVWENSTKQYLNEEKFLSPSGELGFFVRSMGCPHHRLFNNQEIFTIEQCTGLKDKNGKLIYEGDVITTADDDEIPKEYDIYCIKWAKAYSGEMFCAIDKKGELQDFYGGIPLLEYARIIGNIHDDQFREVTKKVEEQEK